MLFCLLFLITWKNKRKPKTEVFFPDVASPGGGSTSGKIQITSLNSCLTGDRWRLVPPAPLCSWAARHTHAARDPSALESMEGGRGSVLQGCPPSSGCGSGTDLGMPALGVSHRGHSSPRQAPSTTGTFLPRCQSLTAAKITPNHAPTSWAAQTRRPRLWNHHYNHSAESSHPWSRPAERQVRCNDTERPLQH